MPKFYQENGLTVYSLSCGYIQRAEATVAGKEIRVDLWHEGACFHARAHDFTRDGRLEWISEESITDARRHWSRMVRQYLGVALVSIRKDRRYGVIREHVGEAEPRWSARFCGDWLGKSDTKEAAWLLCYTHKHTG